MQATINTYIWYMHSEGSDVFVISPRQWEVQEENEQNKKPQTDITSHPLVGLESKSQIITSI